MVDHRAYRVCVCMCVGAVVRCCVVCECVRVCVCPCCLGECTEFIFASIGPEESGGFWLWKSTVCVCVCVSGCGVCVKVLVHEGARVQKSAEVGARLHDL